MQPRVLILSTEELRPGADNLVMNYIAALILLLGCLWPVFASGQTSDLDYYLPPGEVIWVADSDTSEQRYLMLYKQNHRSYVRGLIMHIPDWNMHPYQSPIIRALYQAMPEYGWQSYALQPPNTDIAAGPWQANENTPYPSPISEEALTDLRQPLQQRLTQALAHLEPEPGLRVVVAEGVVAAFLIQLYAAQAIPTPDAFIVIGPYLPQLQLNNALAEQLASFSFPVLDLQPAVANSWSLATAANRTRQAQRLQHPGYRQVNLPPSTGQVQARQVQQLVYGWLSYEGF